MLHICQHLMMSASQHENHISGTVRCLGFGDGSIMLSRNPCDPLSLFGWFEDLISSMGPGIFTYMDAWSLWHYHVFYGIFTYMNFLIFMVKVCKYTSPIEVFGGLFFFDLFWKVDFDGLRSWSLEDMAMSNTTFLMDFLLASFTST